MNIQELAGKLLVAGVVTGEQAMGLVAAVEFAAAARDEFAEDSGQACARGVASMTLNLTLTQTDEKLAAEAAEWAAIDAAQCRYWQGLRPVADGVDLG